MRVLLTGGAGYIGSHTAIALLDAGHEVTVLDDLSNGSPEAVRRVELLTGRPVQLVIADLADRDAARRALAPLSPDAIIHFAGLKAVGESVRDPVAYYRTNINATLNLLDFVAERAVRRFVFSSSATVYGAGDAARIDERHPSGVGITNPYGWTKAMNEQILRDAQRTMPDAAFTLLRYFNPVGAHPSGLIGESPRETPNNLMPYVAQVAAGRRSHLNVFGDSYDTVDGTGVRDYIHVVDLAEGHLAALHGDAGGTVVYNLGTGEGHSVLQVVDAYARVSGRSIPYRIVAPREGDVATSIADPSLAASALGWRARFTLEDACRDSWRWQTRNPDGLPAEPATGLAWV